jgi:hypothetical protein
MNNRATKEKNNETIMKKREKKEKILKHIGAWRKNSEQ